MTTPEDYRLEIDRRFESLFCLAEKYGRTAEAGFSDSREYLLELIRRKNSSEDRLDLDGEVSRERRVEFEAVSLAAKKVLTRSARLLRRGRDDVGELGRTLGRYSRRLRRKRGEIWRAYLETGEESYAEVYRGVEAALERLAGL